MKGNKFFVIICITIMIISVFQLPASVKGDTTVVDETVNVPALGYYYYYNELEERYEFKIEISVKTTNKDITFIIMDSTNYQKWASGENAKAYVYKPEIVETTVSWSVPETKRYYFVLDNTDSLLSTTVYIKISYSHPNQSSINPNVLIVITLLISFFIAIFVSFLYKGSKQKSQDANTSSISKSTLINS